MAVPFAWHRQSCIFLILVSLFELGRGWAGRRGDRPSQVKQGALNMKPPVLRLIRGTGRAAVL